MITDKITNIDKYSISKDIIIFINEILSLYRENKILLGRKELKSGIYANIEEYNTKTLKDAKFETHDEFIDIQILLNGQEKIYYTDRNSLSVSKPYDNVRDITFYCDDVTNNDFEKLDGTNFILLFPQDAHAPQVAINNSSQKVLKAVIKIKKDLLF